MSSSRRLLLLTSVAMTLVGPASVQLRAGTIGTNFPATGAFSEVSPSSWSTASWVRGATFTAGAGSTLEVGVYSANATMMVLEIYSADTGANATYDYAMTKGGDNVWRAAIASVPANTLYAFRAWGPNWPFNASWARGNSAAGYISDCDTLGNRFNPNKVLYDPYTREMSHNVTSAAMLAAGENAGMYGTGGTNIAATQTYTGPRTTAGVAVNSRNVDTGQWAPKAVAFVDNTATGLKPHQAQQNAIVYETHLKGLTAHPSCVSLTTLLSPYSGFQDAANVPTALRGTYAGAAYMAGYLKDLGFNTVEFLPIQETNNATASTTSPTSNYWGYMTYGFFAPDRRFASNQALGGPTAEFKSMVAAFHKLGIEVYLDVVYNHTGEGGTWDGTGMAAEIDGFRGLDNMAYYTSAGSPNDFYWCSTGCGNNFNGGSAPAAQLVTDSLTYWANTMGVDGFRFDLAVELGRNGSGGFSGSAPLLTSIAALASANNFKVIAEPWDCNDGGEVGNFPAGWAEWNGNFRDATKLYMQANLAGQNGVGYADAFYGSYNQFSAVGPQKSVNLIDCHDGFTMTDLVSFGSPANSSLTWPFGPSDGGASNNNSSAWGGNMTMRRQVIRDFWTFQVLSRGVPMMVWGDEFGRTVNGNNNAYDVDSVATWNNYNMIGSSTPDAVATGDLTGGTMLYDNNLGTFAGTSNGNFVFLQYLLNLKASHAAFRQTNYTSEAITFSNPSLTGSFSESSNPSASIYVSGSQVGDEDFVIFSNTSGSSVTYTIPASPAGTHWVRLIDTNNWAESVNCCWPVATAATVSGTYSVNNQSIVVLEAVSNTAYSHTITFNGTVSAAGFTAAEACTTSSSGYTANITWDANYLYIGYTGADVSATSNAANKLLVVYLGDGNHPLNGTRQGVSYGPISYTLPFSATYVINWQSDWNNFDNASWTGSAWSWTNPLGMTQAAGTTMNQLARNYAADCLTMRIPRSAFTSNKVNMLLHFVNDTAGAQWTYGMAPATTGTDGAATSVAFGSFFTFDLTEANSPLAQDPAL